MVKRFMAIYTPEGSMPQEIRVFHTLRELNQWRLGRNLGSWNIEVLEIMGSPVASFDWTSEF